MPFGKERITPVFKLQTDESLDQANPVQNQWYPIMDAKNNVRLLVCRVSIETTSEDIEVRWTIDGITLSQTQAAAVAGTAYFLYKWFSGSALVFTTSNSLALQYTFLECRSAKVEIRKTTNNGSGNLKGNVTYAQMV